MKNSFPANHFNIRRDPVSYREVNGREKLLLIFVLIFLFSISCIQAKEPEDKAVKFATDFKLQDLNQNTFTLFNYKDRQPVILFFWTTWCPFCALELRTLKGLYPQLTKEGWELLAINVGESKEKVDNFVKKYILDFKVLLDKDTNVAYSYNVLGVPTYVLLDKKGQIVFKDHYFPRKDYQKLISN